MEIFKIIGFALVSLFLVIVLKSLKKDELSLALTLIASIMIFSYALFKIDSIVSLLNDLVSKSGINSKYLLVISYIVELATNICKDAGNTSIASKLEMVGKITIVVITIPILSSIIEVILEIV